MTTNPNRVPAGVPAGGQFAASARDEANVNLTVTSPAADVSPLSATIQPQAWVNDYAVDSGPAEEFQVETVLSTLNADERERLLAEVNRPSPDLDWVYDRAVEAGTANPGHGPYYVSIDPDELRTWLKGNPIDPTEKFGYGVENQELVSRLSAVMDDYGTSGKFTATDGAYPGSVVLTGPYEGEMLDFAEECARSDMYVSLKYGQDVWGDPADGFCFTVSDNDRYGSHDTWMSAEDFDY